MFFLNPSFLWALAGLSVPLAIHLWSKKKGKHIKVGSIKFLKEVDTKKSKSIALNEIALLLIRMGFISVLVCIISEPRINDKTSNTAITYLIEPSLMNVSKVKNLGDSLSESADVRLLQEGFPEYTTEAFDVESLDRNGYWQYAQALQDLRTDSLVVFTKAQYKAVKGKRPSFAKPINWVYLDVEEEIRKPVAMLRKEDEIEKISVWSNANQFQYFKDEVRGDFELKDSIPFFEISRLQVQMYAEDEFQAEEKFLKATFQALSKYLKHPIEVRNVKVDDSLNLSPSQVLIWLSKEPTPSTKAKILQFKQDPLANSLIESGKDENKFYITERLNSENIVEMHLAEQLIGMLSFYTDVEKEAEKYDIRAIDLSILESSLDDNLKLDVVQQSKDIAHYFWMIFLILLVAERVLSKYRKQ